MNILQVIPSFYPASVWGGPVQSTYSLCNALAQRNGVKLRVLTTDTAGPSLKDRLEVKSTPTNSAQGYQVYYCRRDLALSFSVGMLRRLLPMIRWADIVHLTAVYSAPTLPTLAICRLLNKPVVWSPRGSLQRWEGGSRPRLKRWWEITCNYLCDKERVTLHFTSDKELLESTARIERASVVVIPNGVDTVKRPKDYSHEKPKSLRLMYLGRLDRIKGIENLLTAMKEVDGLVTLSICGAGSNGYAGNLKALTERLGIAERVKFEGHVTGEEKTKCFASSDVFVMPSFSESFGLSTAEALSYGLPVIASKGAPWSEVEKVGCGLWVENDPQSLAEAIERIRQMPLEEMGRRGREWMSREFSWEVIAGKMFKVYEGLVKRPHDD